MCIYISIYVYKYIYNIHIYIYHVWIYVAFFAEVSSISGWYCQVEAKIFSKLRPSRELVCFRNSEQAPVQLGHEMLNGCLSQRWSRHSLFFLNVNKRMFKLHAYYYILDMLQYTLTSMFNFPTTILLFRGASFFLKLGTSARWNMIFQPPSQNPFFSRPKRSLILVGDWNEMWVT